MKSGYRRIQHAGLWNNSLRFNRGMLASNGSGMRSFRSWMFEPFETFEKFVEIDEMGMYRYGRGLYKAFIAHLHELISVFVLTVVTGIVAFSATSANDAINGFVIGAVTGLLYYLNFVRRLTPHLGAHTNPMVTTFEFLHGKFGLVLAITYQGVQYAGAFIASALLNTTSGFFIGQAGLPAIRRISDDWINLGALPALNNSAGAFFVCVFGATIILFFWAQQHRMDYHRKSVMKTTHMMASTIGITWFVVVAVFYQLGFFTFNPAVYAALAVTGANTQLPITNAWVYPIGATYAAAAIAWVIHWLGWNVNALRSGEITDIVDRQGLNKLPRGAGPRGEHETMVNGTGRTQKAANRMNAMANRMQY